MGAAAYVGRVGGLAVALGVGSAVFAGQGVAWADDADSSASKPSTSATSPSGKKDRADTTGTANSTKPSEKDDAAESDADDPVESDDDPEPADENEPEDEDDPEPELEDDPEPEDEPNDEDDDADQRESESESESTKPRATKPAKSDTNTETAEESTEQVADKTTATSTDTEANNKANSKADDPAVPPQDPKKVAVFANASTLATASSKAISPAVAALLTTEQDQEAAATKPNLITAVINVVTSMFDWAHQKAAADPGDAPQPPFLWALMAFARRELDTLFAARTTNAPRSTATAATSEALTDAALADAAAAAAPVPSYSPWPNPQVSPSTRFISWLTGTTVYPDKTLANTLGRFGVYGTDVGVMWDNGMVDNPDTPWNENQVLIAVGDTFGSANMSGRWIYNTLFRSSDRDLSDGMTIPDGEWFNGNMFGGAPLSGPKEARPIINRPSWLPGSVTLIPTAGVSLPTEVTDDTPFGTIQYVSFMSVSEWGQAGRWTTNYSAIAYSYDNGENFTVAPESVRYNSFLSGNRNFQQSAFVKGEDGYVYVYGTPNGRQGAAYVARVAPDDILNVSKYEYYKKASSGWLGSSPARWVQGSPSSASAVIGKTGGACGATKPGYSVSEMSVQYNEYLQKYVVLYGDQSNNIVMRTSDTPEGGWSDATVLMAQQTGGIYAPMLHPWSPSTQGTGSDLYWNLSLWSDYNIMLMKTDLTKI